MTNRLTQKQRILARLAENGGALAVHELGIMGISDNSAATRLSELQTSGLVVGEEHPKGYKVWRLPRDGEVVKITRKPRPVPIAVIGDRPTLVGGVRLLTISIPPSLPAGMVLCVEARAV